MLFIFNKKLLCIDIIWERVLDARPIFKKELYLWKLTILKQVVPEIKLVNKLETLLF